jgi:hypothetical protein
VLPVIDDSKVNAMKAMTLGLMSALLLGAAALAGTESSASPDNTDFKQRWGGLLTSTAFRIEPKRPEVILPPASLQPGDQLWIRPQRLNSDEYLILQRCIDAICSKTEVVRAWNAYGYMGPYPVLTRTVRVQAGGPYMLWMQHVPGQGVGSFRLYDRDAPPLVFEPAGAHVAYNVPQLKAAQAHGPEQIRLAQPEGSKYVASFEEGSTVEMQALRAPRP